MESSDKRIRGILHTLSYFKNSWKYVYIYRINYMHHINVTEAGIYSHMTTKKDGMGGGSSWDGVTYTYL